MQKNPALAAAFRRISLGFLIESIAFFLGFFSATTAVEPFILPIGAALMVSGFYLAARQVSGFKNPLFLKIIVFALLLARLLITVIFDSTLGLGIFITAAQMLLDLACIHYVCLAVPVLFPSTKPRATTSVRNWATLHTVSCLCAMLPGETLLIALFAIVFMISSLIVRIKYFLYLKTAQRAA